MADVMADSTERMLVQWEPVAARGETIDLASEMMHLTQRIIVRTMFSTELRAGRRDRELHLADRERTHRRE